MSGQIRKLIEEMNEALKVPLDAVERDLVELGRLLVERPGAGELVT